MRNIVLFPGMVIPLAVGRERSRAAVYEAARSDRLASCCNPANDGRRRVRGVRNRGVLRYITAAEGARHAICQGTKRFRVLQYLEGYPFLAARVEVIEEAKSTDADVEGRAHSLRQRAAEILQLLPQVPEEVVTALQNVDGPAQLADFIGGLMDIGPEERRRCWRPWT